MRKRLVLLLMALVVCLALGGCAGAGTDGGNGPVGEEPVWAIYWYLCGSDLEGWYGCATADLEEMMAVELPENVKVVIQTGGTPQWQNETISAEHLQRYVYDSDGLRLLDSLPVANMGESETLRDFLQFCRDEHPAEHTMALFWNHGGGSIAGAAFDANYSFDALTLDEFHAAFEQVYPLSEEDPPFDVVGFDACLMATVDVADTFRDVGRYLVASEETEPGIGWYYTGWLGALAEYPEMEPVQLGREICDAYMDGCMQAGTHEEITLSVTDLSKVELLLSAYNDLGVEALAATLEDSDFFTHLGREAIRAENYGGNTDEQGYTNLLDLGHLVRNSQHLLPDKSQAVLDGLEACVVYQVNGPYREQASGLSCYYNYSGDTDNFIAYTDVGCSEAFKYLYGYGLSGTLSAAGEDYMHRLGYRPEAEADEAYRTDISALEGWDVAVDDMGCAQLYLGEHAVRQVAQVCFLLAYVDYEGDYFMLLGRDDNLVCDWESGLFTNNFSGYWTTIDGHLVYNDVVYQGSDYTLYSIPILLNGEQYNLRVVYDYGEGVYEILGARRGLSSNGMADKNLVQLKPGDEITTVLLDRSLSGTGGFDHRTGDTFTVTEDTRVGMAVLPEGTYAMLFEVSDVRNQSAWSELIEYRLESDGVYVVDYTP